MAPLRLQLLCVALTHCILPSACLPTPGPEKSPVCEEQTVLCHRRGSLPDHRQRSGLLPPDLPAGCGSGDLTRRIEEHDTLKQEWSSKTCFSLRAYLNFYFTQGRYQEAGSPGVRLRLVQIHQIWPAEYDTLHCSSSSPWLHNTSWRLVSLYGFPS